MPNKPTPSRPWAKHPEPTLKQIREQLELLFGREKEEAPEPEPGSEAARLPEARREEPK